MFAEKLPRWAEQQTLQHQEANGEKRPTLVRPTTSQNRVGSVDENGTHSADWRGSCYAAQSKREWRDTVVKPSDPI